MCGRGLGGGIVSFLATACLVLPAAGDYGGGSGTASDPYRIFTAEHLSAIGAAPADWGRHFTLMADIDHFKSINDAYGHAMGDKVLKQVAQILRDACRKEDIVARYGGEEFLIILPETSPDKAVVVAERLRRAIGGTTIDVGEDHIHVTVSGGLSSYAPGRQEKDLIKEADDNLYGAKDKGKNRIYYEHF